MGGPGVKKESRGVGEGAMVGSVVPGDQRYVHDGAGGEGSAPPTAADVITDQQRLANVGRACGKQQLRTFKRICVFCGSSSGKKDIFSSVALSLGRDLVRRNVDLVYGGGSIGLMGQVAQTVHAGGGHVIGVIPKALMGKEICGQTVGELIAVLDMHQRKAEMARLADAFIALPGGYGTLEELLEVITWSQLGIHEKPVGLLNVDGYYNPLLALFDKALEEGFLGLSARNIVVSAPTASELLDKMEAYSPIPDRTVPKLCWEDAKCLVHPPAVPSTVEQG